MAVAQAAVIPDSLFKYLNPIKERGCREMAVIKEGGVT